MIAFKHAVLLTIASAATALGCRTTAGTETDNPFHSEPEPEPPPYESPIRFNPEDPDVPGCPPPNDDTGPSRGPYWGTLNDQLVVGVDRDQLIVIDVSDPAAPERVSVTPLNGYVHAVVTDGAFVFAVIDERPAPNDDVIAEPSELEPIRRLVRYDVTDPAQPERVGAVDLPGEFWRLRARGDVLWLMAATLDDDDPASCELPGRGCYYPERTELLLRGYRPNGDGFELVDSLDLPMTQRAWSGKDGFVSLSAEYTEDGIIPTALHVARFGQDGLVTSELRPLPADPGGRAVPLEGAPVEVVGSHLYFFSRGSGEADSATLHVVDVSEDIASELSRVEGIPGLPRDGVEFTEGRIVVGSEDFSRPAWDIDLSDPAAPVVRVLPTGVARAVLLDGGQWLAWGDIDDDGLLELGILGAAGLERVAQTSFATSSALSADAVLSPRKLWSAEHVAAFLYPEYEPYRRLSKVATIDLSADPLQVSTFDEALFADELLITEQWLFAPDFSGIATVPLDADRDAVRVDFEDLFTVDVLPFGERVASLAMLVDGRRFVVVHDEGRETARIEVPGTATELMDVAGYIGVLLDQLGTGCEQSQGRECDETGVILIDGEEGAEVGTAQLPAIPFESPSGTSTQQLTRSSPLRLDSGEWAFVVTESVSCVLEAECEALAVEHRPLSEVNVVFGSVADCPPDAAECPPPPPEPEVYGYVERARVYVLDASDPRSPEFRSVGEVALEEADSSFAEPRVAGNRILLSRLERTLMRGQSNRDVLARVMLDAFSPDPDLPTWRSLNVPGYAVGGTADGKHVYTAEPLAGEAGVTLYRLRVTEQGAYVEASRLFEGRYSGVQLIGEHAYVLLSGSDGCSNGALESVGLDVKLTPASRVELPGPVWDFAATDESSMLLIGPNYTGYALFGAEMGEPQLAGFYTDLPEHVRLYGGELWWITDDHRVEHRR